MPSVRIGNRKVALHCRHTVIVGAGAAGMNCAVHLCEFLAARGIPRPADHVAVITGGVRLGASRMSGSDKQTYYKMGTSPSTADSAAAFARTLSAAGCVHEDLALAEAVGSLREFYHLVQAGVPFPHDRLGSYVGYKTDHDPFERATSAGPRTSRMMSEALERQARAWGVPVFDGQEVARLVVRGRGEGRRIVGVLTIDRKAAGALSFFACENLVLAAGGPGELYRTTVYPRGQIGIHGLALEAGLAAENLTESQFGLASTRFRWNVSGTYMQAVPRIYSTDPDGRRPRDFLADAFPTMARMATAIFLKGYQWPFDPQRVADHQSSLIDLLVHAETERGRRVFLDFRRNPVGLPVGQAGRRGMAPFRLEDLEAEARAYLAKAGAVQRRPIDRLAHMNPLAIDIYAEHGIDLRREPLGIALCAQHNNGGMAVDPWWQSSIRRTFVIGEMAGTHGVKRPGGSALNAGQVGGLRAAEYIAHAYPPSPRANRRAAAPRELRRAVEELDALVGRTGGLDARRVIGEIQDRMTAAAGHIRQIDAARAALAQAIALWREIGRRGFRTTAPVAAVRARHMALASVAYLAAIVSLLDQGGGSRGSHLVLDSAGQIIHPDLCDPATGLRRPKQGRLRPAKAGRPMRMKPENERLRRRILRLEFDPSQPALFRCQSVTPRRAPKSDEAFEVAWDRYRRGAVFD